MDLLPTTTSGKIITCCALAAASEVAWRIYKKIKQSKKDKAIDCPAVTKVLFFDADRGTRCCNHLTKAKAYCLQPECPVRYLKEMLLLISQATSSLDICVYFITFSDISRAIEHAFNNNVKIRIISDYDMTRENCEQIVSLKKKGLKIRSKKTNGLVHHKFCIVDKKLLITGSTNWTFNGFFGNYENVIITNQPELVIPFNHEFERIWKIVDNDNL